MPIFEYSCRKCNHHFETVVISVRERIACPKCQSSAVEKQLSMFNSRTSGQEPAAAGCGCTPQTCGCR
jgi:putative FmdB family regulatory protein